MKKVIDALKAALDPVGPIGNVISPADVYKERLGLPVTAPHVQRVRMQAPAHIDQTLAAPRFVSMQDAVDVPKDRVRQVSAYVEEHWSPVYRKTDSTDLAEILRASQEQIGWQVTQRQSASSRAKLRAEDFQQQMQSLQIQAREEFYNGYYETIPGNDPIVIDGKVLTGGTRISGGRREYAQKTKGMIHWDAGTVKKHQEAVAEMNSRPVRNAKAALERQAGAVLPMRRLLPNPRYDRKSAV